MRAGDTTPKLRCDLEIWRRGGALFWPARGRVEHGNLLVGGSERRIEQHDLLVRVHTCLDQLVQAMTQWLTEHAEQASSELSKASPC